MKIETFEVDIEDKKGNNVNNIPGEQEKIIIFHDGKFKVGDTIKINKIIKKSFEKILEVEK